MVEVKIFRTRRESMIRVPWSARSRCKPIHSLNDFKAGGINLVNLRMQNGILHGVLVKNE
jgi:hypothetical protein